LDVAFAAFAVFLLGVLAISTVRRRRRRRRGRRWSLCAEGGARTEAAARAEQERTTPLGDEGGVKPAQPLRAPALDALAAQPRPPPPSLLLLQLDQDVRQGQG